MINNFLGIISYLIIPFLFLSCTGDLENETDSTVDTKGKVQIALQVPATGEDGTSFDTEALNESVIRNLTLFIFDSSTGEKEFSTYISISPVVSASSDVDMGRWLNEQIITILNTDVLTNLDKSRDVHVVGNYTFGSLDDITTEMQLNEIITDPVTDDISYSGENSALVMHGMVANHNFADNAKVAISLIRNIAKVKMTLATKNFTFGGKNISLAPAGTSTAVKVINQADRSYLVSREMNPSTVTYFNGQKTNLTADSRTDSTVFVFHAYINENLRESYSTEVNATALILQIPYQKEGGEINENNYYKILINGDNGYKINRNTIYDITASISTLGGETDVSAVLVHGTLNVLPWDENTIESDLTQTFLSVEKSTVRMGVTEDFPYKTNALPSPEECSVVSDVSWLTATVDFANSQVKLTASTDDYTAPRTGTFNLKVRNLTKVITVTQAPRPVTTGSISLNPRRLLLSEATQSREASLTVTPTDSRWLMMGVVGNSAVATCSPTSGTGNGIPATLTFTNGTSYGNTYYKFANLNTMEYDSIEVCNLHLEAPSAIEIGGQGGTTDFADDLIKALGGDANWNVVNTSGTWLTATNVGGVLRVTATEGPDEQERTGTIAIAHVNDPNYIKTIQVKQLDHIIITIPEFDYLLFRYDWTGTGGKDLDTATEFTNTGLANVDNRPLGYGLYGHEGNSKGAQLNTSGLPILVWGGDNVNENAGESVYVNVKNLCSTTNYDLLPRFIFIDLYAIWWERESSTPIKVEITAYKGGEMVKYGDSYEEYALRRNFHNDTGENIYSNDTNPSTRVINKQKKNAYNQYRTEFVKVGRVTFDKIKRTANIEIYTSANASAVTSARATGVNIPPQLEGESKDDYSLRLEKYYNNKK